VASAPNDSLGTVLGNLATAITAEGFTAAPVLFSARKVPDTLANAGNVYALAIDESRNVNYRGSDEMRLEHQVRASILYRFNIHDAVSSWEGFVDTYALKLVDALLDKGDDVADYDVTFVKALYGTDTHGERIAADLLFKVSHDFTIGSYL